VKPSCLHRLQQSLGQRRRDRGRRTALVDQSPWMSVAWSAAECWAQTTCTLSQSSQRFRYRSSLCTPIGTTCTPTCTPATTNQHGRSRYCSGNDWDLGGVSSWVQGLPQKLSISAYLTINFAHKRHEYAKSQSACYAYRCNWEMHPRPTFPLSDPANHSALFDLVQEQWPITPLHTTNNQSEDSSAVVYTVTTTNHNAPHQV